MFTENEHEKYKNVCEDAFKILEGAPGVLSEDVFDYAISVAKVIAESKTIEEKTDLSRHALRKIEDVQGTLTEEERSVYDSNPGLGFTYRFVTEDHTTGEQFFADEQQVRARGECVFYETVDQNKRN